jgi:RimJ/RimL family protein N-acetyltransferase
MGSVPKQLIGLDFACDLEWRKSLLHLTVIRPEHKSYIQEGLKHLSAESIRHRFFSVKRGFTEKELKYFTEIDGQNHFALGLVEKTGQQRGVAIVRMVKDQDNPHTAEIAIIIIDDYQKMGLGLFLLKLCFLAAKERDISHLRFTYMSENAGIKKLLNHFGSFTEKPYESDAIQRTISLDSIKVEHFRQEFDKLFQPDKSSNLDR